MATEHIPSSAHVGPASALDVRGTNVEYAIRYDDQLIQDPSFQCIADVIASFHAAYTDEQRRVTGVLVRRVDGGEWVAVGS